VRDDDAFAHLASANDWASVYWVSQLKDLVVGTGSGVWVMRSVNETGTLTPSGVEFRQHYKRGTSRVQPVEVDHEVLFVDATGQQVVGLHYSDQRQGYEPSHVSIVAGHLFRDDKIKRLAMQKAPQPVLWVVTENGKLRTMTYAPEHGVLAWQRHETGERVASEDIAFEDVAVVPAVGTEADTVYCVVRRGSERFIERMTDRFRDVLTEGRTPERGYFVDSGIYYDAGEGNTVTEIDVPLHLEGLVLSVLLDGGTVQTSAVSGGKLTLPRAGRFVCAGLPYEARVETLDIVPFDQTGAYITPLKALPDVTVYVEDTRELRVGSPLGEMSYVKLRTDEAFGEPAELVTAIKRVGIEFKDSRHPRVVFQTNAPVSVTVNAVDVEVMFDPA
jgi:hypothetical protein